MKVLFIHNSLPEYRVAFFRELSKLVELDVVVTEQRLAYEVYGLKVALPKDVKIIYADRQKKVNEALVAKKYDLVVLPPIDNFYQMQCAFMVLSVCSKRRIKTVYWTEKWEAKKNLQPYVKKIKNHLQANVISFFANRCNICIAAGKMQKQYLIENGIAESKIVVAVDSSTSPANKAIVNVRELYQIGNNKKIILFLGRLIKRKGCDLLIDAFSKLISDKEDVHLLICGEGDEEKRLKDKVEQAGLYDVSFCGKIQPNQRADYFSAADVFVLPSYTCNGVIEAWGLTVNESLEQGTPVVATTAVGAAYEMADNICCIMVAEKDTISLATGIKTILHGMKKQEYREKCAQLYKKYDVVSMAKQFFHAFEIARLNVQ